MVSRLTILTSCDGKLATKRWSRDNTGGASVSGYDKAYQFHVKTFQIGDIRDLHGIYQSLASKPSCLVIRGVPAESVDQNRPVLRRSNPDKNGKVWFVEPTHGLHQVTLDFDNIQLPAGCDIHNDPEGVVEHIIGLLPERFWDASCIWQYSGSAGMLDDGKISLHITYWFNRPVTNAELKIWASNVNDAAGFKLIDPALFQTVQPHYVAHPIFEGIEDPILRRSGFREGICDEVDFPIIAVTSSAAQHTPNGILQQAKGFDAKLALLGDGPGLAGFHTPLREAAASYAAEHGSSGTDRTALKEKFRSVILAAPKLPERCLDRYLSDTYLNDIINSAMKKFGNWVDRRYRNFETIPFFPAVTESKADAINRQQREIGSWADAARTSIKMHRSYDVERKEVHAEIEADDKYESIEAKTAAKAAATKKLKKKYRRERARACGAIKKLLITGSQGSGKTSECLRNLSSFSDGVIIMLLPTLEKAEEALSDYEKLCNLTSPPGIVLRGRGASSKSGEVMCRRNLLAERVARVGLPVSSTLCRSESGNQCPHFDECPYQTQMRRLKTIRDLRRGVIFASHQHAFSASVLVHADAVIIDESIALKATNTVSFAPDRITEAAIGWTQNGQEDNTACASTAITVREAIESDKPILQQLRGQNVTVDDLSSLLRLAEKDTVELSERAGPSAPDEVIAVEMNRIEDAEKWKVIGLLHQLLREIQQPRDQANGVTFDKNASVEVDGKRERQARLTVHRLLPSMIGYHPLFGRATTLFLDGTGNIDLIRRVFGDDIEHCHIPMERRAEVIQVRGHFGADQTSNRFATMTFSRQSVLGFSSTYVGDDIDREKSAEKRRNETTELINGLQGEVFVCGTRGIVSSDEDKPGALNSLLGSHCKTGNYGAIRGLNTHERCQTAVVIGREQPSAEAVEAIARCFAGADRHSYSSTRDKEGNYSYVLQCRGRRLRNGKGQAELTEVHPDPLTQSVLEQIREAEVLQAIDRVRAIFNVRRIIILTSLVLDITVDMALTWKDLKALFALERRFPKVLPLRYDDVRTNAPDLIGRGKVLGAERSAKGFLGRLIYNATSQIDIIRKVALYKIGPQKRPSTALIPTSVHDPKLALEEFLGEPVTYFKIQPGPDVTDLIEPPALQETPTSSTPKMGIVFQDRTDETGNVVWLSFDEVSNHEKSEHLRMPTTAVESAFKKYLSMFLRSEPNATLPLSAEELYRQVVNGMDEMDFIIDPEAARMKAAELWLQEIQKQSSGAETNDNNDETGVPFWVFTTKKSSST